VSNTPQPSHLASSAASDIGSPTATEDKQAAEAISEVQEYLDVSQQRRRVLPRAVLVGVAAGSVAVVFRLLLVEADALRNTLIAASRQIPAIGWLAAMLFSAAGATASVMLVQQFAPETRGSGIPHLKGVLHRLRELRWQRVLPVKMIGGVLALGSGLALGREGPTVQMGGATGDAIARWLKAAPRERLTLTAAGAGAGLAAAFNAPLSGVIFVLEEMQRDFRPIVFGAAFISAVVADILSRLVSGQAPVFAAPAYAMAPLSALPAFVLLGITTGALGVIFNHSLLKLTRWVSAWPPQRKLTLAAAVGASIGLIAWFSPIAVGSGHVLLENALHAEIALAAIPFWFLARFALTIISYSTGAPGGIFAPMLTLGGLIGLGVGYLTHAIAPEAAPQPAVFAVVGMAAYFAAIVRAPLTGISLVVEMTGSYEQMLGLLVSCFVAYAVAELLKDLPIYEALLERDLAPSGLAARLKKPMVLDLTVEAGAPFEGREISKLGLPPGCILVRCQDGGREWVPTASTHITAGMRITAVIAPEAAHGLSLLRHGCQAEAS